MSYLEKEIEAYLNDEMTLDQRKIFEKKVADDSEVKKGTRALYRNEYYIR